MSPRSRVIATVAAVAAAAAGTTVAGALVQGRATGGEVHGQTGPATTAGRPERPALELAVVDRDDAEARSLREAERLYERDRADEALRRFRRVLARDPASVEAQVGAAVAAWPDGTTRVLAGIVDEHPESAVARLNYGLALLADGDAGAAEREWREAEARDPDAPAALRAEDLRNPRSPPGRPQLLLPDFPRALARLPAERRLAALRRRAEAGSARDWLFLGSALESVGHRVSAQRAYDRALALDPGSVDAQVAAAVARFDKDEPVAAFSRLGPLAARHPRAAVARFHLGLLLLWLPDVENARRQLARARAGDPGGFYGGEARRILARLDEIE